MTRLPNPMTLVVRKPNRRPTETAAPGSFPGNDARLSVITEACPVPAVKWREVPRLGSRSSYLPMLVYGRRAFRSASRAARRPKRRCRSGGRRLVLALALETCNQLFPVRDPDQFAS